MAIQAARPHSLFEVGHTPLLEIGDLSPKVDKSVRILAKAEWHNPGGSVKDRPALSIVQEALRNGLLGNGRRLLDASSGNTAIAYAWICARLSIPLTLAVPGSLSAQRRKILEAYGAELVFTDPLEGSDGAIREARLLAGAEPENYFYADQYSNEANPRAHYEGTAVEIFEQSERTVTHFVAGVGTSGTFVGTTRRLKELNPRILCVSVEPDSPLHGLEGLKHMETAIVPGIYDRSLADERMEVATEEAQRMAVRLARERGLLIGPSGGANLIAALRVAERLAEDKRPGVVVTVFPDSGERYLEERFWKAC